MADSEQARFCSYGLTKRHLSVSDVPVPIPVIPIPIITIIPIPIITIIPIPIITITVITITVITIKKNGVANANPLLRAL